MTTFKPYTDDEAVLTLGELSIENGRDSIAIHGSLDLRRDADGLRQARALLEAVRDIVTSLESDPLDAPVEGTDDGGTIPNPFA